MPAPTRLHISVRSDTGQERRNNQDTALVTSLGAAGQLLAVCDGMGGAAGGEVASRRAATEIEAVMLAGDPPLGCGAIARRLVQSVVDASRAVFSLAAERPELCGMGTTATACVVAGERLIVAQVGDSRAYVLRRGRLTQVTRDQTLATLLIEKGQLTPEEARTHQLGHIILQAVGTSEVVEVDLGVVDLCRGDVVLVCSDGLYGAVGDDHIREVLATTVDCDAAAEALIALANAAGGPDNITCIVARVTGAALPPPTCEVMPRKLGLDVAEPEPDPESKPSDPAESASGSAAPSTFERLRDLLGLRSFRTR